MFGVVFFTLKRKLIEKKIYIFLKGFVSLMFEMNVQEKDAWGAREKGKQRERTRGVGAWWVPAA